MSFGSDAGSLAPEGVFVKSSTHPRAYGNFARLLGTLRARREGHPARGSDSPADVAPGRQPPHHGSRVARTPGYFADVVVFDPKTIQDHATYEKPHQYSTGMRHVWVNGTQVLKNGEHTGAKPGQVVRGPGWSARPRPQAPSRP